MGNQICCQQPISKHKNQDLFQLNSQIQQLNNSDKKHTISEETISYIPLPQLSQPVNQIFQQHKPFQQQFNQQNSIKTTTFGNDVYHGPLDQTNRPTQIGKMYKSNGDLFIGHFISGKAQGPCFYIMKDGSYYKGQMKNNQAQCTNGTYINKNLQYIGGFKNNAFDGKGYQRALDKKYIFEGVYLNGNKKQGIMKWGNNNFDYIYQGKFDQNGQFTANSKLTDPQGVYQGQFVKGEKHGFGSYLYASKLRYEGQYSHNKKQGQGKIINHDGTIAYKGVFKNGMPNGKGIATSKTGQQFEAEWKDGIDVRLLQ